VDSLPRWSPDGRWIAFERRFPAVVRDQGWFIMDVSDHEAGTFPQVKPLTHAMPLNRTQLAHMPWSAWSTDSTRFLYIANDLYGAVNSPNLYMAYADGSGVVQLTNTPNRHEWDPVWRP
jgi:Tol biopolymer transport system component